MRKLLSAGLIAALAAAQVGCSPGEPRSVAAKEGREQSALPKNPVPPDPPAAKATPERPAASGEPADDTDPVIRAAELSTKRAAELEARIDQAFAELSEDIKRLEKNDVKAADRATAKLRAAVGHLRQTGRSILAKHPKIKADFAALGKAVRQSKVGYGRAKEVYLARALEEAGELRTWYESLAEMCDGYAATAETRGTRYAEFARDLDKAVEKVERYVRFLDDFDGFLKLDPGSDGAKERDEFLARLNVFTEQILTFGKLLREFRSKGPDAGPEARRAEPPAAIAARAELPDPARGGEERGEPARDETNGRPTATASAASPGAATSGVRPVATAFRAATPPTAKQQLVTRLVPVGTTQVMVRVGLLRREPRTVTRYEWHTEPVDAERVARR